MSFAAPNHPDLAYQLPADSYYHLIHTLCGTLPPPLTDSPEDLVRRNHSAIARIAALQPANPTEADLAGVYVAASEQWKDCLRLAQQPEISPEWAMKCRAQANTMMRQAQSALRLLLGMQATRQKIEADSEACDRAAWTERCAIGLMADALSPNPAPLATPDSPATEPHPEPVPLAAVAPLAAQGPLAAAEQYAAIYPERAAMIRRTGRLPDNVTFDPPPDDVVQALLTARTPDFATPDCRFAKAAA